MSRSRLARYKVCVHVALSACILILTVWHLKGHYKFAKCRLNRNATCRRWTLMGFVQISGSGVLSGVLGVQTRHYKAIGPVAKFGPRTFWRRLTGNERLPHRHELAANAYLLEA